eukprot:gene8551-374_t
MFKRTVVQLTERIQRTNTENNSKKNFRQELKKLKEHLTTQYTSENSVLFLNFSNATFDDINIHGIMFNFDTEHFEDLLFLSHVSLTIFKWLSKSSKNQVLIHLPGKRHSIGLIVCCYLSFTGYFSNSNDATNYLKDFTDFNLLETPYAVSTMKYLKLFTNCLRLPLFSVKIVQIEKVTFRKFPFDIISPFFMIKQQSKVLFSSKDTRRCFKKQTNSEYSLNLEDCQVSGDFILNGYSVNQDSFELIFRCTLNTIQFSDDGVFNIQMKQLDLFDTSIEPFTIQIEYKTLNQNDETYKSELTQLLSNSPVYLKKPQESKTQTIPTSVPNGNNFASLIVELKKKFFGEHIVNDEPILNKSRKSNIFESKKRKGYFDETQISKSPKSTLLQKKPQAVELLDMSFQSTTPIKKEKQKIAEIEEDSIIKDNNDAPLLDLSFDIKKKEEIPSCPTTPLKKETGPKGAPPFPMTPMFGSPPPCSISGPPPFPMTPMGSPPPAFPSNAPNFITPQKKNNLKALHWTPIMGRNLNQNSLWSNVDVSNVEKKIDKSKLEDLFSARNTPKKVASTPKSKEVETIVSSSRARNIEILIKQFKNVSDLSKILPQWINELNVEEITPERLNILEVISPTFEEQSQYLNYPKKNELVGIDKLLMSIICVPNFRKKLKTIKCIHACKLNNNSKIIEIIENKSQVFNLLKEEKFSKILEIILIIGNTMNSGKKKGNARGFKIDILPVLSQTKSMDKKTTLMDFLVQCCQKEEIDDFWVDFESILKIGTKLNIEELEIEIFKVKEIWNHFKDEQENLNSQNKSVNSNEVIEEMEKISKKEFIELNGKFQEMKNKYNEVLVFFGEENQKDSDLFTDIYNNYLHEKSTKCLNLMNKQKLNEKFSKASDIPYGEQSTIIAESLKEISTVLGYIFQQYKRSNEWKNYISTTYNLTSKSLFEEVYTDITLNSTITISGVKFSKVEKLSNDSQEKFFVFFLSDLEKNISSIRQDIIGIKEKLNENLNQNILPFIDLYDETSLLSENERELYLITKELKSNLTDYIDNYKDEKINENEVIHIGTQIASALQFLHDNEYYFSAGELMETCIFLDASGTKVYLDPGFLQLKNPDRYIQYPPEYENTKQFSSKYDVFSFGLILLRLATKISKFEMIECFIELNNSKIENSPIFKSKKQKNSFSLFTSDKTIKELSISLESELDEKFIDNKPSYLINIQRILLEKNVNTHLKSLITSMLSNQPNRRPNMKHIHHKLKEIPIKNKEEQELKLKEEREEFERIKKINESFYVHNFIKNKKNAEVFKKFLQKEMADENLIFIENVEIFKELKTDQERIESSFVIFQTFFNIESKYELNISKNISTILHNNLQKFQKEGSCPTDIFDFLVDEILVSCLDDKYQRFRKTPEFINLYENSMKKKSK